MSTLTRLKALLVAVLFLMFVSLVRMQLKYNCKTLDELLVENQKYYNEGESWWQEDNIRVQATQYVKYLKNENRSIDPLVEFFDNYMKSKNKLHDETLREHPKNHTDDNIRQKSGENMQFRKLQALHGSNVDDVITEEESRLLENSSFSEKMSRGICELFPSSLVGLLRILMPKDTPSLESVSSAHPEVTSGGEWHPSTCLPRQNIVIIVPYMKRTDHLPIFLDHIHALLQRQQIAYTIVIIEQLSPSTFNRGALLNIGFRESMKHSEFDCAVFHDVDLLGEHDHNLYQCKEHPLHLSPHVNTLGYRPPGRRLGGVCAFRPTDFRLVNGFSNSFWGWGGEDDDLYLRASKWRKLPVERAYSLFGRYTMIPHSKEENNTPSQKRLKGAVFRGSKYEEDGLNSIKYNVVTRIHQKLYTHISVDITS